MSKISKVLIANRGEIALRIIRACKELEMKSVVVFSEVDVDGVWVRKANECYPIMGHPVEAYLNFEPILSIAKKAGCDAIHPGYGFLSESAEFAQACADNGIIFIGPSPAHIELFGDKMASKVAMKKIGVPVLEGTDTPVIDKAEGEEIAKAIGFPIIKAAFGGGGRGMQIVRQAKEFSKLFDSATNESIKYFGRGEVFIEKYVENPRHIEVQVIADKYGNVVHLGERDCSIQRRHQKVIEIAPSPLLSPEARKELYRISTKAIIKLGYESVGTVEYLLDEDDNIYFIEMNTRVQVEHSVTEVITGVDIIQRMIQIAEGDKLQFLQEEIKFRGYAIEFRINSSLYEDYETPSNYDSMIGKLIVSALDWEGVVKKARRALDEYNIDGLKTNISLHREIVRDEDFKAGRFNTGYLDSKMGQFNMSAKSSLEEEKKKISFLASMIKKIKEHKLITRS